MGLTGVKINRLNGGLGRKNPTLDGVALLIVKRAVAATGLAIKTAVELLSLKSAEDLGINATYDDTNSVLAHYHVDEFFRIAPDGKLFLVLDDGTLTNAEIKTILKENSSIKFMGVVTNSVPGFDVLPSTFVSGYQALVDELRLESRNISAVLLESGYFDIATTIATYQDLRTLASGNVSVVISQDPVIAALKPAYATHAAIGTALGALSVRGVNESLGSVDIINKPSAARGQRDYPLTDLARGRWLDAALQSGKAFSTLTAAELQALNDKGYIFVASYNGYAGFFFNDSHTATTLSDDFSRIENNRVFDKAAGLLRNVMLPKVKANIAKNPATGTIGDAAATELEALGNGALQRMQAAGEISGFDTYIDRAQTLANDVPLRVKAQVVVNGIIHSIEIDLGLTNKLQ